MNALTIADLPDSQELDREALSKISGAQRDRGSKLQKQPYVVFDLKQVFVTSLSFMP
jgi:hypothetical protein